jgi:hypothetical protein
VLAAISFTYLDTDLDACLDIGFSSRVRHVENKRFSRLSKTIATSAPKCHPRRDPKV